MMHFSRHTGLRRLLLAAAAGLSLVAAGDAARAASSETMLRTAENACLDAAVQQGWRRDLAKVVSSRAVDADRVEVVFDLSRDGRQSARLTCPYSARQGVVGQLNAMGSKLGATSDRSDFGKDFTKSMSTAGNAGGPVDRSRAWWLLLPVGLAALAWAGLRNREGRAAEAGFGHDSSHGIASGAGSRTADAFVAEVHSRDGISDGSVNAYELADATSLVRRRFHNGATISLTGRRSEEWLEVDGGGWVHEADVQVVRAAMAAGRRAI
jgi:hypothetical protein